MQRRGITHRFGLAVLAAAAFAFAGCATTGAAMAGDKAMMKDEKTGMAPMAKAMDPMMSAHAAIDRFGSTAHLQMRDAMNHLPGPDAPVDFDKPPFVTTGLGPHGETVVYYNFDVQSTTPAPIYVLYRKGESDPVPGQLNIVDVVPGEPGYNDFWRINKVTVPPHLRCQHDREPAGDQGCRLCGGTDPRSRQLSHCACRVDGGASAEGKRHWSAHGMVPQQGRLLFQLQ
jgi:hypothetical protein